MSRLSGTIIAEKRPYGYEVVIKSKNGKCIASTRVLPNLVEAKASIKLLRSIMKHPNIYFRSEDGELHPLLIK